MGLMKHCTDKIIYQKKILDFFLNFDTIFLTGIRFWGDDREAEGNALLMRRMVNPYRGFESLSLR